MVGGTEKFDIDRHRLLSLEIRSRRFGFVVIENWRMLDWGMRTHESQPTTAVQKVDSLLDLYAPAAVVIRNRGELTKGADPVIGFIRAIRTEARRYSATVRAVTSNRVRAFFLECGAPTKHDIAATVAGRFPDLAWSQPPKRKPWESERYNTPIYDAAATAIVFLAGQSQHYVGSL